MKHKTWFRLVLKAIGILLIGLTLPSLVGSIGWIVAFYGRMGGVVGQTPFSYALTYGGSIAGQFLQFAIGLYLLLGGRWLVNRIIPSNRPYCPDCGYDLSKNTRDACPECGVTLPGERLPSPPGRGAGGEGD